MTGTLIFLALGLILLGILLATLLLRQQPEPSLASESKRVDGSQAILTALELNLPSRELADRIFAKSDLDFILREAPSLKHVFLRERTSVAIRWLRATRNCTGQIFRFYRLAVRSSPALEFWTELRIARDYCEFLLLSYSLQVLIYLLGPFLVRGVVTRAFAVADRISIGVGQTVGAMDQSSLMRIKDDWAKQATPSD